MYKPIAGSALCMALLLVVGTIAAAGGHGTYVPAQVSFPYSMLSCKLRGGSIGRLALALALGQTLAYGVALGGAIRKRRALFIILAIHATAALACILLPSDSF